MKSARVLTMSVWLVLLGCVAALNAQETWQAQPSMQVGRAGHAMAAGPIAIYAFAQE